MRKYILKSKRVNRRIVPTQSHRLKTVRNHIAVNKPAQRDTRSCSGSNTRRVCFSRASEGRAASAPGAFPWEPRAEGNAPSTHGVFTPGTREFQRLVHFNALERRSAVIERRGTGIRGEQAAEGTNEGLFSGTPCLTGLSSSLPLSRVKFDYGRRNGGKIWRNGTWKRRCTEVWLSSRFGSDFLGGHAFKNGLYTLTTGWAAGR